MMGKKEYKRWDYDDETEITMEEQLTLEENPDHGGGNETPNSATFPQPNIAMSASPLRSRENMIIKRTRKTSIKEKAQLFGLSAGVLLVGFIAGFAIGVRDKSLNVAPRHSKHSSSLSSSSGFWSSSNHERDHDHETNELSFRKIVGQISAENIRHNLKRMSQEEHTAGTAEGKQMAKAIRDLWGGYGLSVRMEPHKTLLTKTESFNFVEALDGNGTVTFTTSQIGDSVNLPNARPMIAFSPPGDINGTLVYGHYGRYEDLQLLRSSGVLLNGSIALIRFGSLHPSKVVATSMAFGVRGIIFYPDPEDVGPLMPGAAIRRSTLLTVGQVHEYQKQKGNWGIPCHTIGFTDAEHLLGLQQEGKKAPEDWQGALKPSYFFGGLQQVRMKIFNEPKSSNVFNLVAAIPGVTESDRYVIVGCSHDSWTYGAGDPGVGLAITTEMVRVYSSALQKGWRPRRSILFVSWDANLYSSSGLSHWLQEHHFEIGSRAIAYIDLSHGVLRGNHTLQVYSSPLLREVARRAIARVKHSNASSVSDNATNIEFFSHLSADEPSFAFLGNLGIPFLRLCVSNSPKGFDYPLFHTAFDTYDNFVKHVDSNFKGAEALGRIITEMVLLLADSTALPINLGDYLKEIQKGFDHFMAEYQEDLHKANLSIAYLQAAVMRLEVIGDNFKSELHNRSAVGNENDKSTAPAPHRGRKNFYHRIVNDKLLELERAFLSRNSDGYKHQVIGFTSSSALMSSPPYKRKELPLITSGNASTSTSPSISSKEYFFPKVRAALDCGRESAKEQHPRQISTLKKSNGGMKNRVKVKVNTTNTLQRNEKDEDIKDNDKESSTRSPNNPTSSFLSTISSQLLGNGEETLNTRAEKERENGLSICHDWRTTASQKIASLVRSLDAASAILQSPLLPEDYPAF